MNIAEQDTAAQRYVRQAEPVRIAFAGRRGAGKSSIINLLVGSDVLATDTSTPDLPPIILKYAYEERTVAGWWDQPDKVFQGLSLEAALTTKPDVITFELNCEALQDLWLIDIPALDEPSQERNAIFALSKLADVLVWCGNARQMTLQDDHHFWKKIPKQLNRFSILAMTHIDMITDAQFDSIEKGISPTQSKRFRSILPVATPLASAAFSEQTVAPSNIWADSGAEDLINAVLETVEDYRATKVKQPRQENLAPSVTSFEPFTVIPSATPPLPVENSETSDSNHLSEAKEFWVTGVRAVLDRVKRQDIDDNETLVSEIHELIGAFLTILSDHKVESQYVESFIGDFETAENLLVLLQFETSDEAAVDAACILLQLCEILSSR